MTAVPRRSSGRVAVRIQTAAGRLAVDAVEPVPDLPIGREVVAFGTIRTPAPWEAGYLERYGIRQVLDARSRGAHRRAARRARRDRRSRARSRGGRPGRGTPGARRKRSCAGSCSARTTGSIRATVDDFKRSGLAHLLAVSGDT